MSKEPSKEPRVKELVGDWLKEKCPQLRWEIIGSNGDVWFRGGTAKDVPVTILYHKNHIHVMKSLKPEDRIVPGISISDPTCFEKVKARIDEVMK